MTLLAYRRGGVLLAGVLTYTLYGYASRALQNAYNPLFLVYMATFSASLCALVVLVGWLRRSDLGEELSNGASCS